MRMLLLAVALMFGAASVAPVPAAAQGSGTEAAPKSRKRAKSAKPKREPTVSQMAARERQRKCSAEWKEAKSKGTAGSMKWPRFYSQCNARLKGGSA